MFCGLFFLIGMAAIVQLWEWPKSTTPHLIPTAPSKIVFPKEMFVRYEPVFLDWMISPEGAVPQQLVYYAAAKGEKAPSKRR